MVICGNTLGKFSMNWPRGYHVSTVGGNEEAIRKYIKEQEREDRRIDQLSLY
jgi:putative transposase